MDATDHTTNIAATSTMAVTAPTYVLEESLSSQKLWKQTAGNRPPQPVEERAFFEQMWSQNFMRSKVKYEIPVEVLTASTPISISPFHDGDDGAYNLAGGFGVGVAVGARDGDGRPEVQAAAADVAEATLEKMYRPGSGGGTGDAVEMYLGAHRPKDYDLKTLGPHRHHHTPVNRKVKGSGDGEQDGATDLTVVVRGDNVFGTTVSKSFGRPDGAGPERDGRVTVSVSIASYRVVESRRHGKYAQYLVIFCDGHFRNTVGVWKRYSDFSALSRRVSRGRTEGHDCRTAVAGLSPLAVTSDSDDAEDEKEAEPEILHNAMTSWKLLRKRQRWYRCLDAGYLSLKVFLLERFLHDILFESSTPRLLREFCQTSSA